MEKAYLVLETGEIYTGKWHGGKAQAGEVVFNTSHSGYEEIATDPSYFSQIVVMTSAMQGNYGIHPEDRESEKIFIEGFICQQLQTTERDSQWQQWLQSQGVPVVSEFDTRTIVKRLRQGGTPWGALVPARDLESAQKLILEKKKLEMDWVHLVSRSSTAVLPGEAAMGPRVAVLDLGTKSNIIRELQKRCSEVHLFSSRTTFEDIMKCQPQAILLTNGPGNPEDVQVAPDVIKKIIGKLPIFGICMGHQVLSLALGAKTYKLKFGHRGANHPIKDLLLNKIYMTSQNHGYAVKADTLPKEVEITHWNLNDNTVAGIYSEKLKCLSVQFHPESRPGPHEAEELFDFFIEKMIC